MPDDDGKALVKVRDRLDGIVVELLIGGGSLPSKNGLDPNERLLELLRLAIGATKANNARGPAFDAGFHRLFLSNCLQIGHIQFDGRPSGRNIKIVLDAATKMLNADPTIQVRKLTIDLTDARGLMKMAGASIVRFMQAASDGLTEIDLRYVKSTSDAVAATAITNILTQTRFMPSIDGIRLHLKDPADDFDGPTLPVADLTICTDDFRLERCFERLIDNNRLQKISTRLDHIIDNDDETFDTNCRHSFSSLWKLEIVLRKNRSLLYFDGEDDLENQTQIMPKDEDWIAKIVEHATYDSDYADLTAGKDRLLSQLAGRIRSSLRRNRGILALWQTTAVLIAATRAAATETDANAVVMLLPAIIDMADGRYDGTDGATSTMLAALLDPTVLTTTTTDDQAGTIDADLAAAARLRRLSTRLYRLRFFKDSVCPVQPIPIPVPIPDDSKTAANRRPDTPRPSSLKRKRDSSPSSESDYFGSAPTDEDLAAIAAAAAELDADPAAAMADDILSE